MTELIIILVVALLVIGPEKLPELARTLGKGLAEFKKTAEDFRDTIHEDLKADEEKEKLLQKAQQTKENKPKKTDTALEEQEKDLETETEKGPIADQAPTPKSVQKDKPENHD